MGKRKVKINLKHKKVGTIKRIKWKRGMEVTPATFEEIDRYKEETDQELRRLHAIRGCGIIPKRTKNVNLVLAGGILTVQVGNLEGITSQGQLLQIAGDTIRLNEPRDKGHECYLAVRADGEKEFEVNNTFYRSPRFTYDFCSLSELDDYCLPFAKLIKDNDSWRIQDLYIPPCMTVGADPELTNMVSLQRGKLASIIGTIQNRVAPYELLVLRMLLMEIDGYRMSETPNDFFNLLKRIVLALSLSTIAGTENISMPVMGSFEEYDILKSIQPLFDYIADFHKAVQQPTIQQPKKAEPAKNIEVWDAEI